MKTLNLKGFSVAEISKNAPFELVKNATTSWVAAGFPKSGEGLEAFIAEYTKKNNKKQEEGVGFYVVVDAPVVDKRENPYTVENVKNDKGTRKYTTIYELINETTGEILGSGDTQKEAEALAKEIICKKRAELGVGVKHVCKLKKVVAKGVSEAFTFAYTPTLGTKEGSYFCFGIEKTESPVIL